MLKALARIVVVVLVLAGLVSPAAAKRVALVIGNGAYEQATPLKNPKNDADALASVLERLGFEVIKGVDLNRSDFERMVRKFSRAVRGADAALLFYAGHGLQVNGRNYLAPVDARLTDEADLEFETLRLETVLAQMERETRVNLVFLDACRDNPLARNLARSMGTRSASVGRGLARVDTGVGTLIAFATEPGNVALDGSGANSPFTEALLKHIETPNLDIARLMRRVRKEVLDKTSGRQVPWSNSSLTGDFVFAARQTVVESKPAPKTVVKAPPKADPKSIELAYWNSVKDSSSAAALESYLERFPNGVFSDLARIKIEELKPRRKKTAAVAPSRPARANTPTSDQLFSQALNLYGFEKYARALQLFRQAADQGHLIAMYNIGVMYANGRGVAKDDAEAVRWFRSAAEAGEPSAMYNLGAMMEDGRGTKKDDRTAAQWIFKALKRGNRNASTFMTGDVRVWSLPFRREMQRLLKAEGVYDGAIDGQFGSGTRRAIEALAAR